MKFNKLIAALALVMFLGIPAIAQEKAGGGEKAKPEFTLPVYDVEEMPSDIEGGSFNAFAITIPNVSTKDVESRWKKVMKKNKAKVTNDDYSMKAEGAKVEAIQSGEIDVFAKFKEREDGVKLVTLYDLGDDSFISSAHFPEKAEDVTHLLNKFARTFARDNVEDELKEADKELKKRNNNLKKLKKENDGFHSNIAKWKEQIAKAEEDIVTNLADQETARESIAIQEGAVKKVERHLSIFDKD